MAQMTVTLEWDDDLGPGWFDNSSLLMLLRTTKHTDLLSIKSFTPLERLEEEFHGLLKRLDTLDRMTFRAFMGIEQRDLLQDQHKAMTLLSQVLRKRIESWT